MLVLTLFYTGLSDPVSGREFDKQKKILRKNRGRYRWAPYLLQQMGNLSNL